MTKDEALQLLVSKLQYNQETGDLIWVKARSHRVGKIAGYVGLNGYRRIGSKGYLFRAHRLCWFIVYGSMPEHEIDHINGLKDDNRLCNLRQATLSENRTNVKLRSDNKVGFKGVRRVNRLARPYRVSIQKNGRRISLGNFETAEQAHDAYVKASIKFHGEFANTGKIK